MRATLSTKVLAPAAACVLLASLAPAAAAHDAFESQEHGELVLAFERDAEGVCQVTVTGRHVGFETGVLAFLKPPTGPGGPSDVLTVEVDGEAEADGVGFTFTEGPFDFPVHDEPYWVEFRATVDGEEHLLNSFFRYDQCRPSETVLVHQDETSGAVVNVVGCTVYAEGRHVVGPGGTVYLVPLYPLLQAQPVDWENVTGEPEEDGHGFRFMAGPLTLEHDGLYVLYFFPDAPDSMFIASSFLFEVTGCTPEGVAPDCPGELAAYVEDGVIELDWWAPNGAHYFNVYRAEGDGEFEHLGETGIPYFSDVDIEPGVTYTYHVTAVGSQGESEGCDVVTVTAVPFFGAPVLGIAAAVGGVGAYGLMRRKQD